MSMSLARFLPSIVLVFYSASLGSAVAVSLGQSDTFEDGTVQSWSVGAAPHPAPPTNIATGGPGGLDDNYLRVTALGGGGAGSRLAFFNASQWSGNFLAAGITGISMQVNNFGPSDAHLRLRFAGGSNIAITNAIVVPAGSGWSLLTFTIDPASLVTLQGNATGALSSTTELRIFHNPAANYPNPPIGPPSISVVLGFDNIQAVPEPSSLALLAVGALALVVWSRKSSADKGA